MGQERPCCFPADSTARCSSRTPPQRRGARRRAARCQPLYVSAGLAWEPRSRRCAARLLATPPFGATCNRSVTLRFDMQRHLSARHTGRSAAGARYDTPDEDVYLEGRNIVLLVEGVDSHGPAGLTASASGRWPATRFPMRHRASSPRDGGGAVRRPGAPIEIEAPLSLHKADVIELGAELGVPLELTLSCMQPSGRDALRPVQQVPRAQRRVQGRRDRAIRTAYRG